MGVVLNYNKKLHTTFQYNPRIHYSNTLISNIPIIVQNQVNVEMVLHNLELLGVDPDQSWVVDAENTGRVASIFSLLTYNIQ